jgi:ribosomal-protein-alanine N-acetyltransferase
VITTRVQLEIRPVQPDDRQKLANLIHFETSVHRHLDWRQPLDWIGWEPYFVAETSTGLAGALACPPDPPSVAWLRLFAASAKADRQEIWAALWDSTRACLERMPGVRFAAAIPLQSWLPPLLKESGFSELHRVVMLVWENNPLPPPVDVAGLTIRPMSLDDLPAIQRMDAAAFSPIWQNSLGAIELAFRQAAAASVAELDGRPAAYQISTATPMGGHLARLAVLPEFQGRGIGRAVLYDLLAQFKRHGALNVTVNTQADNQASLALYSRAGFRRTGEEYPIYQLPIRKVA